MNNVVHNHLVVLIAAVILIAGVISNKTIIDAHILVSVYFRRMFVGMIADHWCR